MFSRACEYGVRACVVVAKYSLKNERISLKDISEAINSPTPFTSKILQKLSKHGIIKSIQGVKGGFVIEEEKLHTIVLGDIVDAIDGNEGYNACVLGLNECSDTNPCPAHKRYKFIKKELIIMLKTLTIVEMVNDTENGFAFLKIMEEEE